MTPMLRYRFVVAASFLFLAGGGAARLVAVEGVEDTVIITADWTDNYKWPREAQKWDALIRNTLEQLDKTDELIRRVGDSRIAVDNLVAAIPTSMGKVTAAVQLPPRTETLKEANQQFFLNSVGVKIYRKANEVDRQYHAFDKTFDRSSDRYVHFTLQEAMNARFQKAAENAEAVEKEELQVQEEALKRLKGATTQADIEAFSSAIAASKGRLDLAHAKALQAKAELDAFSAKLGIEVQRKAEADREWTQTVVNEMRTRALEAYDAQSGKKPEPSGS